SRLTQLPPQAVWSSPQAPRHVPSPHSSPAPQAVSQSPQKPGSDSRFTQAPSHSVSPGGQVTTHSPATHRSVPSQAVSQSPQWLRSLSRVAHTSPQRAWFPGHPPPPPASPSFAPSVEASEAGVSSSSEQPNRTMEQVR